MESSLADIYGFTDIPIQKCFEDDVFYDKIDDMLAADIDMDMFDKFNDMSRGGELAARTSSPLSQPVSSPNINPDDFLNDFDGDDVLTISSDRSSPSFTNSPPSFSPNNSCDNNKSDSSSDESINVECLPTFHQNQNMPPQTVVNSAQIFPSSSSIRILQGTLIPVSTIKIETAPASIAAGQPIVLNSTNSNCIRMTPKKVVLPKFNTEIKQEISCDLQSMVTVNPVHEQALKKQLRMIKNRESASVSRNRKKEYVMSLETQVKSLLEENNVLKNENNHLKAQISNMLATCQCRVAQYSHFTKSVSPQSRKNAAILLAMIFMVSMSFGNINSLLNRNSLRDDTLMKINSDDHVGRNLLWSNDYVDADATSTLKNISKTVKCNTPLNQTENSRIETDLRNWININEDSNATYNEDDLLNIISGFHNTFKPSFKTLYRSSFKRKNPYGHHDWLEARKRRFAGQPSNRGQKLKNQMQLFYPARRNRKFSKLFEEIGRRDDTFYILSFNNDHMLLSAASHNKSTRPRMSFVLPADDSLQNDKVTLMQIDCEVMNTSVIELKKEFIPEHLRAPGVNRNDTDSSAPSNSTRSFNVPNKHDIFSMADTSKRVVREKNELNKIYKPYFVEKSNFDKESSGEFNEVFLT